MSLDAIYKVFAIISLCLAIISSVIVIIQRIRYKKKGFKIEELNTILQDELSDHNKRLAVLNKVAEYINEAEELFAGTKSPLGKLNYAKTKLKIDCAENGIKIPDEELELKIEEYLSTPQKHKSNEEIANENYNY